MDPWQILAAVATIASTVIGVLWKLHLESDVRERDAGKERNDLIRAERDRFAVLLEQSLQNNRDAIAAWTKRDETDAARKRRAD